MRYLLFGIIILGTTFASCRRGTTCPAYMQDTDMKEQKIQHAGDLRKA